MPSRRAVLAAVGALAGCAERRVTRPTETATAVSTPTVTPLPDDVAAELGDSRFEGDPPCPGAVPCYHRLAEDARPQALAVPERERLTPDDPATTVTVHNLGDEQLVLADPLRTYKWTDIHWAPTHGVDVPDGVRTVEPGGTLERGLDLENRGDGRYALVEYGYFGGVREPATVRPDEAEPRRLNGEFFRFGAQFEVTGAEWAPTRDDVPTERDDDGVVVHPDRPGDRELVLEASDESEGLPVVPEALAAHPPTKNAVLTLAEADVERVRLPTVGTARWYLEHGIVYRREVEPDLTLRHDDLRFTIRTE